MGPLHRSTLWGFPWPYAGLHLAITVTAVLKLCQLMKKMPPRYMVRPTGPRKSSSHLATCTQCLGRSSMRPITSGCSGSWNDDTGLVHLQLLGALDLKVKAINVLEGLDESTDDALILHSLAAVAQQAGDRSHRGVHESDHAVQGDLGLERSCAAQLHEQQQQQSHGQLWPELHGMTMLGRIPLAVPSDLQWCWPRDPSPGSGWEGALWVTPIRDQPLISSGEKPRAMKAGEVNSLWESNEFHPDVMFLRLDWLPCGLLLLCSHQLTTGFCLRIWNFNINLFSVKSVDRAFCLFVANTGLEPQLVQTETAACFAWTALSLY